MQKERQLKKQDSKDIVKELINNLNVLALNIVEEIMEARKKKKTLDFENIKAPLLAIKEIKDLVKINDKLKERDYSNLLDVDDFANINKLEEALYEEGKE